MDAKVNCNKCKNVNITEEEQHQAPQCNPHICKAYNKRLIHRTQRLGYHEMLYPCYECEQDNYKKFETM